MGAVSPGPGPAPTIEPTPDASLSPALCAEILDGDSNIPTTLVNFASPCDYFVDGGAVFRSDVEIPPGTLFLMGEDSFISFQSGNLVARGTDEQPIVFRGVEPITGYWSGIDLQNMRSADLRRVLISDGGQQDRPGLNAVSGPVRLDGVEVSNSFGSGLAIAEDAVVELFRDNRFYGNRLAGLSIDGLIDDSAAADVVATLDESSDYSGGDQPNGLPVVQVDGLNVRDRRLTLPRINAAWELNSFSLGRRERDSLGQLVLPAGTRLKLSGTRSTRSDYLIGFGGEFRAEGTADSPIVIERAEGDGVPFPTFLVDADGQVFLDHVQISEGGGERPPALRSETGLITLDGSGFLDARNTRFADSASWGVFCTSRGGGFGGSLTLDNVSFADNALGDIGPVCGL